MNRQVLFRAKALQDYLEAPKGTWVYGYYTEASSIIDSGIPCIQSNINDYIVDKDTVCQYCNMNDEAGNALYENDIIAIPCYEDLNGKFVVSGYQPYVILWSDTYKALCATAVHDEDTMLLGDIGECKLLGNIFDGSNLI